MNRIDGRVASLPHWIAVVALCLITVARADAAPAAPTALTALVSGSSVTLTWSGSFGAAGYRLEAGTAPGLVNAANVLIGGAPSYVATNVPTGVYYVRVRAVAGDGESLPSNEIVVTVGDTGCVGAPGAPNGFSHTVVGSIVTMTWLDPSSGCAPTGYVITAGSAPSLANLATLLATGSGVSVAAPNGTFYVRVFAVNAQGASASSNEQIVIVGSTAPPTSPPPPTAGSFGPGQYRVNVDVPPGRYYSSPARGCYWERQSGFGGSLDDVISNEFVDFDAPQWIIDILPTDRGFETDVECGRWYSTPRQGAQNNIAPPGVWLVGSQITPGTYRVSAGVGCYWERLRDFTNTIGGVIDNEFVDAASVQIVTVSATDVGFYTHSDCGTWTRISAGSADARDAEHLPHELLSRWMLNAAQHGGQARKPLIRP